MAYSYTVCLIKHSGYFYGPVIGISSSIFTEVLIMHAQIHFNLIDDIDII